ncbi:hypothetical protein J0H58_14775 [bacterium]|nr:hypothetical protein [bacterium]
MNNHELTPEILLELLRAPTWDIARQVVERHGDALLSEYAISLLDRLIQSYEEWGGGTSFLRMNRRLLEACRSGGIEAAFRGISSSNEALHRNLVSAAEAQQQFTETGDLRALDDAVETLEQLAQSDVWETTGLELRAVTLNQLVAALTHRYQAAGNDRDLQRARTLAEELGEIAIPGSEVAAMAAVNRATVLGMCYEQNGNRAELDAACALLESSLSDGTLNLPNIASASLNLASALRLRYEREGDEQALDRAIDLLRGLEARLDRTSPESADVTARLLKLLLSRYRHRGSHNDLDSILDLQGLSAVPEGEQSDVAARLIGLANDFARRGMPTEAATGLDLAIQLLEAALERLYGTGAAEAAISDHLGRSCRLRYQETGGVADLDRAIRSLERAHSIVPKGHDKYPSYAVHLGDALTERAELSGDQAELDRAIGLIRTALDATPLDSKNMPAFLNSLAISLGQRHQRLGRLEDLDEALELWRRAAECYAEGSDTWQVSLSNRCIGLRERYSMLHKDDDIQQALSSCERIVQLTPPQAPAFQEHIKLFESLIHLYAATGCCNGSRLNGALGVWKAGIGKVLQRPGGVASPAGG